MSKFGWHITFMTNVSGILKDGLYPSEDGYLEDGVYLWKGFSQNDLEGELKVLQNCLDHIFDYLLSGEAPEVQQECENDLENSFALLCVKIPDNSNICEDDDMLCIRDIIPPQNITVIPGWVNRYDYLASERSTNAEYFSD